MNNRLCQLSPEVGRVESPAAVLADIDDELLGTPRPSSVVEEEALEQLEQEEDDMDEEEEKQFNEHLPPPTAPRPPASMTDSGPVTSSTLEQLAQHDQQADAEYDPATEPPPANISEQEQPTSLFDWIFQ